MTRDTSHGLEDIFNIAMTPVLALDSGYRRNIWIYSQYIRFPRLKAQHNSLPAPNAWTQDGRSTRVSRDSSTRVDIKGAMVMSAVRQGASEEQQLQ